MKQKIKYSYCIDEEKKLVNINDLTPETRHEHNWYCLQCGKEMVANLGTKRAKYFSHKAETACDGESYLHKLAKYRIREKFESADIFPITFVRSIPCDQQEKCLFFEEFICQMRDKHISFNLKEWYDKCSEEVKIGEFRSDLLLTKSTIPGRKPILIEVYKTHHSEDSKMNSKHKIIETIQIKSEDEIEDIIKNGFVEGKNCIFNFSPQKLPSVRMGDVSLERFVLLRNGVIYRTYVLCRQQNEKVRHDSVCELNMQRLGIELFQKSARNRPLNHCESVLVYLVNKKNWLIKNCILCKFKKHNGWGGNICIRYKSLGPQYKDAKQELANSCPYYQMEQEKMKYPLSELEKIISEVP